MPDFRKVLLIILALIFLYIAGNYVLQEYVVLPSFVKLEKREAHNDILRVKDAIRREIHHLSQIDSDWAMWDDTYRFVKDGNKAYIKSNLIPDQLWDSTKLNLVYICRLDGTVVWGKIYDPVHKRLLHLKDFPDRKLPSTSPFMTPKAKSRGKEGLIRTPYGPLMLASLPIIKSSGEGPYDGIIIMGRFLTRSILTSLSKETKIHFSVMQCNATLDEKCRHILQYLGESPYYCRQANKANKGCMYIYTVYNDIYNKPALLIKAKVPETVLLQGRTAAKFISITVFSAITLVGLVLMLWFIAYDRENRLRKQKIQDQVEKRTQELREANALIKGIINSVPDIIFVKDKEFRYLLCNHAFEDALGIKEEDILGKRYEEVLLDRQDIPDVLASKTEEVITEGKTVHFDISLKLAGHNQTRIYDILAAPFFNVNGELLGMVEIARDITEKHNLQKETERIKRIESLGVLAGGIAHDFNNILTGLLGNISLTKMMIAKDHKAYERLCIAEAAAERTRELTKQLLTFAKGGNPVKSTANLPELVKDATNFVLMGSNVKAHFYIDRDLWRVKIDKGQIAQVIQNIVINANQAMPDGGIIEISCNNYIKTGDSDIPISNGNYVTIKIKDNGVGIPHQYLNRIFEPYFTTKDKGSGIGLAVSFSIIQKHGGYIKVDSEVGHGSTFTLYLPATDEVSEENKSVSQILRPGGRIMIMDDEELVQEVGKKILSYLGYDVFVVPDGETMLEKYKEARESGSPIDVVIMDLTIPGRMGGQEAIKRLLALYPDAVAVVSSGYANDPVMSNYEKYGFKDIIAKPYSVEDIAQVIGRLCAEIKKQKASSQ